MRSSVRVCLWLFAAAFACHPASAKSKKAAKHELSEDSLQTLVTEQPDNPDHWMELGTLAARNNQVDLAKGYFDEAIKLTGHSGPVILQVGSIWLSLNRVKVSLPYLMPNLAMLDSANLDRLQAELEKEKMYWAQLVALRYLGPRSKTFQPINRKEAILAFRLGEYGLCGSVLAKFPEDLDYESARNLFLVNFFQGTNLDGKALDILHRRFSQGEMVLLAALNYASAGQWREVRHILDEEAQAPSFRDYYNLVKGMEAMGDDRHDEAAEYYQKALEGTWDRLHVVTYAELYRLYSTTGNKFKSDQLWDAMKEEYQDQDPDILEFMGRQLKQRGYEKQAKYFFRVVLRKRPGNTSAIAALWDDLVGNEDYQTLETNIKAALDRDPLSCEANTLAMNYQHMQKNDKEVLGYARNATIYCFESLEPYYVLGSALFNLSRPDEARAAFATYIRKGGDISRVPPSLR